MSIKSYGLRILLQFLWLTAQLHIINSHTHCTIDIKLSVFPVVLMATRPLSPQSISALNCHDMDRPAQAGVDAGKLWHTEKLAGPSGAHICGGQKTWLILNQAIRSPSYQHRCHRAVGLFPLKRMRQSKGSMHLQNSATEHG